MKIALYLSGLLFYIWTLSACDSFANSEKKMTKSSLLQKDEQGRNFSEVDTNGNSVRSRFQCPSGYQRVVSEENSWADYLQNLPLKPHGTPVRHFDGTLKPNTSAYCAVVDLPLHGNQNHQCADAIMRLRAEYLFGQQKYNEIEFLFVSGTNFNYTNYLSGKTPTSSNLWFYLEKVFAYSSTLSLDKQLKSKLTKDLAIGDVFIKGGSPGHAVIVVDKCSNDKGEVKFMLAQSYMPAQDIQILVGDDEKSPWYDLNFGAYLYSAEYTFTKEQLKKF
jgi:hypothetical protein